MADHAPSTSVPQESDNVDRIPFSNVLILNSDLPVFPGWAGIEFLQTTGLAKLATRTGLVSLVHSSQQNKLKQSLENSGVDLFLWQNPNLGQSAAQPIRPSAQRRLINTLHELIHLHGRLPHDTFVQDFQFCNMADPLLRALAARHWQIVIVVQSSNARWLDYIPKQFISVLVMHDVRARLYQRRANAANSLLVKFVNSLEAWRYRQFERHYCREYDLVVSVSAEDEAWIKRNYQLDKVVTIPIPVDHGYFSPMPVVRAASTRIMFTGMMNHPPNIDAAYFFAREVFPIVKSAVPKAEFWVVGRDPVRQVKLLSSLPGVIVTDFVADIRPYMAQSTVIVVPLRFGSGMRQKILEAWGMEKCVVSTTVGAEGLTYEDGNDILIGDDAKAMAIQVVRAMHDPALRSRLGAQGRATVMRQHDPEQLAHRYFNSISAAVANKRQRSMPFRVAVDLRWMRPGEAGGIEIISRSFVNQLLELDSHNYYRLLLPSAVRSEFDLRNRRNFRVVARDGPGQDWQELASRVRRFVVGRLNIADWRSDAVERLRKLNRLDTDVCLSMSGYIFEDMFSLKNVLVVHDLQHEYLPNLFSPNALQERKRVFNGSIRRAVKLIAVSEFTRQTVIDRININPDLITTAHEAADPVFELAHNSTVNVKRVLHKYRLQATDYLFFPANTWPHKNHHLAIQALAILRDTYRLSPLLVMTGNPREANTAILEAIQQLGLERQVRFLGYCPVEDMPSLYRGAAALVYPSLFEGFGLPVLEAMWSDCPVICSNVTSLPEIAGTGAILIDPQQPDSLADAIYRVITDRQLRYGLIAQGRLQAQRFSWHNFTQEIVRTLAEVSHS